MQIAISRRWLGAALLAAATAVSTPVTAQTARIVAIGDSDTAGTSGAATSYPALLQKRLRDNGHDVVVHNEAQPGLIASQAFARLERALATPAKIVILHFGTSDIKYNVRPDALRADLEKMIAIIRQRGAAPLVVAGRPPAPRQVPAGFNRDAYYAMYGALREASGVAIYRFMAALPPPAQGGSNVYQPDGHLTAAGNTLVANDMVATVERLLKEPPK